MKTSKSLATLDSIILAEFILQKYGAMSHLKLQKLVYYSEAMHLAYFGTPLIEDDFQAWLHGPVSRKLYDAVKDKSILYKEVEYSKSEGREPIEVVPEQLTTEQFELLCDTLDEYSKLSSFELEKLTHDEDPWIEAREGVASGDRCEKNISKATMISYYKKELFPF